MIMNKKELRKEILNKRKNLTNKYLQDEYIYKEVIKRIKDKKCIGIYVSMKDEVDTYQIMEYCWQNGIKVCVPKCKNHTLTFHAINSINDLHPSFFNLLEPDNINEVLVEDIDVMICPLVAFDSDNNRIGYGKGYYDSILHRCKNKIGIAYDIQRVESIDSDKWDIKLDEVIYMK